MFSLSLIFVLAPFLGEVLAIPGLFERACNADNCLNAFSHTPVVAATFCSTFLQSTSTAYATPTVTVSSTATIFPALTVFPTIPAQAVPTHFATQCNLAVPTDISSRYSSACHCLASITPATVTTTLLAAATTTTLSLAPTPIGNALSLQIENTNTWYDTAVLETAGCNQNPYPWLYGGQYNGYNDHFVFGSDGFLHISYAACFGAVAGTIKGEMQGPLYFYEPGGKETPVGFVPARCGDVGGKLVCEGQDGQSVLYLPQMNGGPVGTLSIGLVVEGYAMDVDIVQ